MSPFILSQGPEDVKGCDCGSDCKCGTSSCDCGSKK